MPGTIEDRIRERRRALTERVNAGEVFPVPGYDGALWVKLRFLPSRENDEINSSLGVPFDRMVHKLVVSCQGFFTSESGTREDLEPVEVDGVPVRFDRLLASRYGFVDEVTINGDVQPADVVRALMSDYLIDLLHTLWATWMMSAPDDDPALGVADDPVGESVPTLTSDEPLGSS
jgi:hypothetical protein